MADYVPTIDEFRRLAREGYNLIPVYREVVADLETPVSAYLKITGGGESVSFLLESVEGGERMARFSFMGTEPYRVLRTGEGEPDGPGDPLLAVEAELNRFRPAQVDGLPRFVGGCGWLSLLRDGALLRAVRVHGRAGPARTAGVRLPLYGLPPRFRSPAALHPGRRDGVRGRVA